MKLYIFSNASIDYFLEKNITLDILLISLLINIDISLIIRLIDNIIKILVIKITKFS